ncbi:MAG TPA: proliferating cell nuclear antigen (pcna) [Candidatus Nanoarchaeia archaeon]|nr:proliferating cell nuclear antigen (pcna) [Candidatus Nanoarchaeia archaeon]
MKLSLAEPKYIKDSIAIISELVNEARFRINANAIELIAMDPANVAMVIFKLLSSSFVEYNVKEPVDVAINLGNLKQILRRAGPTDTITLEIEESKLKITFKGATIRTFFLPIIDIEEKEQKVPELSFGVSIQTSADVLSQAVEDVDIVGESVSFLAEPSKLTIQAEGDLSKARIEVKDSENTKISMHAKESLRSKYSIEYLKKMVVAGKLAPQVMIHFNNDYPLKLDYKIIDKLNLSFILAPRVESD